MLYGSHQKLSRMSKYEITINNSVINESSAYCYLGVTLDNHLTLQEHVNNIYRKCSARVKLIFYLIISYFNLCKYFCWNNYLINIRYSNRSFVDIRKTIF